MASINDRLPEELICATIGFLGTKTPSVCQLVCKAWNGIVAEPVVARANAAVSQREGGEALEPPTLWAADRGYLDLLRWACANGNEAGGETCLTAAAHGRLDVLRWLRALERGMVFWRSLELFIDTTTFIAHLPRVLPPTGRCSLAGAGGIGAPPPLAGIRLAAPTSALEAVRAVVHLAAVHAEGLLAVRAPGQHAAVRAEGLLALGAVSAAAPAAHAAKRGAAVGALAVHAQVLVAARVGGHRRVLMQGVTW
jgi:hypothetical protein